MSIYCYINDSLTILSSTNLKNINNLDEFQSYITRELNLTEKNINCYYNFSTINLINMLEINEKITKNYLVTTNNDTNIINFLNLNTLCNKIYEIPKLMTIGQFKKLFSENNIQISNIKRINNNDDDVFDPNIKYFYKVVP